MRAWAVLAALAACGGGSNAGGGSGSGAVAQPPPTAHAVAIGDNHVCAVTADGAVACWGDPQRGELGHPADAGGAPARIALPGPATA
ncbi:MAG: RCC1 domain-containing protein, partial [Kofleriaceae bacterium]